MRLRFADERLKQIYCDSGLHPPEFDVGVVRSFRKKLQYIASSADERDLHALRSLNFERLKGARGHQYSIRINQRWRLILELETDENGRVVVVVKIEDYH